MTATEAQAQVNPIVADLQAFLTAIRARGYVADLADVRARVREHEFLLTYPVQVIRHCAATERSRNLRLSSAHRSLPIDAFCQVIDSAATPLRDHIPLTCLRNEHP